jgi:hypothetical protein
MKHMKTGEDPYEDESQQVMGDDPGIDAMTFRGSVLDRLSTIRQLGRELLLTDHGLNLKAL